MRLVCRLRRLPAIKTFYYELLALGIKVIQEVVIAERDDIHIARVRFSLDEGTIYPLSCEESVPDRLRSQPEEAIANKPPCLALGESLHKMRAKDRLDARMNSIRQKRKWVVGAGLQFRNRGHVLTF